MKLSDVVRVRIENRETIGVVTGLQQSGSDVIAFSIYGVSGFIPVGPRDWEEKRIAILDPASPEAVKAVQEERAAHAEHVRIGEEARKIGEPKPAKGAKAEAGV